MFKYLKASLARKIARRITKVYPSKINTFIMPGEGTVDFAVWENPLARTVIITQEIVDFFKKFIDKGDLVIDIGANIGDSTLPMALAAGKNGTTLAFDPNPYVFKILKKNASLNIDKTNIVPFCNAIAEDDDEFYFISSEASFANGGISKTRNSQHGKFIHEEKVIGINLEKFLHQKYENWLPKLSCIKIDTEGYDKEIIKALSYLISDFKPVIIAECFPKNTDKEKFELYEVIERLGYEIYYFGDFEAIDIIKLNSKQDMTKWNSMFNIYAVPRNTYGETNKRI